MKLNFCRTEADRIGNYVNIHPYGSPSPNNIVYHLNFDNFDDICVNGEAEEIRVNESLAYIKSVYHQPLVNYWAKKLSHGGTISFVGNDSLVITRAYVFNQLNNKQYNEALFDGRQSSISIPYLVELVHNAGLIVKTKKIEAFKHILVGERQ